MLKRKNNALAIRCVFVKNDTLAIMFFSFLCLIVPLWIYFLLTINYELLYSMSKALSCSLTYVHLNSLIFFWGEKLEFITKIECQVQNGLG